MIAALENCQQKGAAILHSEMRINERQERFGVSGKI